MELIMKMESGQDPQLYDWETDEDVTDKVYKVEIYPKQKARAFLYRKDEAGNKYVDTLNRVVVAPAQPIVKIYGKWTTLED